MSISTLNENNRIILDNNKGTISLEEITEDQSNKYELINNNFAYLKSLLLKNKKEIQFLDCLRIVDYVTSENEDSVSNLFFNLVPGECVGIDVDLISFREKTYTRGDFLLKKNNGEPQRIKGPSSYVYMPKFDGEKIYWFGYSDPSVSTKYKTICIKNTEGTETYSLTDNEGKVVDRGITYNEGEYCLNGKPIQLLPEYQFEISNSNTSIYNYNIPFADESCWKEENGYMCYYFDKITMSQPIFKFYIQDEENYLEEIYNIGVLMIRNNRYCIEVNKKFFDKFKNSCYLEIK